MDLVILLPYARSVIPSKKGAGIDAYDSEIIDKKLSVALLGSVQAKKTKLIRGSYRHLLKARQPIGLGKTDSSISL